MVQQRTCDLLVHANALAPCAVVYVALTALNSAYAAVVGYELVLFVGPLVTLYLRGGDAPGARRTAARVATLARSLSRPHEWRRCTLVVVGCCCAIGFGGFAVSLAALQRELEAHGIDREIKRGTRDKGLYRGTAARDAGLLWLGVWFCTVNPVLEELFWRGYCYAEVGRILNARHRGASLDEQRVALNAGACDDDDDAGGKPADPSLLDATHQTAASRWLTSCYFASFHGVVCGVFVEWQIAVGLAAFIAVGGRVWIWFAERAPFGFPFVVAFHAGCDVAIVLFVSACDFGWTRRDARAAGAPRTFFLDGHAERSQVRGRARRVLGPRGRRRGLPRPRLARRDLPGPAAAALLALRGAVAAGVAGREPRGRDRRDGDRPRRGGGLGSLFRTRHHPTTPRRPP